MIRLILADDQPIVRTGLRGILESSGTIAVIGEAGDGQTVVDLARTRQPDVILMDLRMPGMDGVEATRHIRALPELATIRILVLTTFETDDAVLAAIRAGANGFLGKGAEPHDLIAAVEQVVAGEVSLSPAATQSLVAFVAASTDATPRQEAPASPALAGLTGREREVLVLVARGLTNREIADHLGISSFTVKTHVNRTMAKLGVSLRSQLVSIAYAHGLVSSPSS